MTGKVNPVILPLSYGPDALCLRGDRNYQIPWKVLAREVSGRKRPPGRRALVTVHHHPDGDIAVTVDHDEPRRFTPTEFSELCVRIGILMSPR